MTEPPTRPGPPQWLAIAALGVTWGGTFLGIKIALEGLSPLWVAALRLGIGAALLGSLALVLQRPAAPRDGRRRWPWLLAIGGVGAALPFFLLSWGQLYVSSGFAGVSMASVALMVLPLSAAFVAGERMSLAKTAGVVTGLAGVVLLFWGRFDDGGAATTLARAACLGGAACYAVASVATRLIPDMDPIRLAAGQLVVGAAIMVPLALWLEGAPPAPGMRAGLALLVLALLPTAAANLLRVFVIRTAGPQFMSLTNYQVPVWAVVFGVLFAGEDAPATLLGALALILSGIAVTQAPAIRGWWARRTAMQPAE
ncbi:MAG: DMT family transporter [Hasllibacter sp.]